MNNKYGVATFLVCLAAAGVLISGHYWRALNKPEVEVSRAIMEHLRQRGLLTDATPLLAIYASPRDCPVCLQESEWWRRLGSDLPHDRLAIHLFLLAAYPSEVPAVQKRMGDRIQVWLGEAAVGREIRSRMETPVKALIKEGIVVSIDFANYYNSEKDDWYREVLQHTQSNMSPAPSKRGPSASARNTALSTRFSVHPKR